MNSVLDMLMQSISLYIKTNDDVCVTAVQHLGRPWTTSFQYKIQESFHAAKKSLK